MPLLDHDRYTHDAALKDGRTVRIRPIRPDDLDAMMAMWSRLSEDTIRLRFFAPRRMDRDQMRHFTEVDYEDRFALVATRGDRVVGVSRLDRLPDEPCAAEFAVLVEDAEQGQGIGTALLRSLLQPAQDLGISHFKGEFLPENRRLRNVLADAGFDPAFANAYGAVETSFHAVPSERFLQSADEQDRVAAVEALRSVLTPASIAVVGASRDPESIGGIVFDNLHGTYRGALYAVNVAADTVRGEPAYPSVSECPTVPETIIVCVPTRHVIDVVDDAGKAGTKAAVIITAGFAETGPAGVEQQRHLLDVARSYGMRVVGPGCMGVLNSATDVRMNGTLARTFPTTGRAGFLSQSGALGLAVLSGATRRDLGLSSFISVGGKVDISGNDLLQYWESDDGTDVVLLYLESFGNPQKFGRIARRVGRSTPIVVVKAGRSSAGQRMTPASMTAAPANDDVVDALFAQAGVIRTRTLSELFDVADMLTTQPLPAGHRVGIVTNAGGPGLLAADACDAAGLEVCELSPDTQAALRDVLPDAARVANPVDTLAATAADVFGRALRIVARDEDVDMALAIFVPPVATPTGDIAAEIAGARADIAEDMPLVAVFMTGDGAPEQLAEIGVPVHAYPEDAARALGHVAQYSTWRRRPLGHVVEVTDVDVDAARAVVDEALADGDDLWLRPDRASRLLAAFGIEVAGDPSRRPVDEGIEMVVGVRHDPTFGPVVMTGMGGRLIDLLGDVRARLHPMTDHDVDDMLAELRGYPLLTGYADGPARDLDALRSVLLRINTMVEEIDEIDEIDMHPVVVMTSGVDVRAGRVRLRRTGATRT